MKKRSTLLLLTMIMVLCTSNIVFAEDQVPIASITVTSTVSVTPAVPSQTVDNAVYNTLISKIDIKNKLILQENQVCKEIKAQEDINNKKVSAIIEKSQSYSIAYNKIIEDIKLLLDPIKDKEALYYRDLTKNKIATDTNAETEASIYNDQISNLNLAIKSMRQSMKYIGLESVKYHQKLEAVQKNIDNINLSIAELNKGIITDKLSKEKEWNNFSSAMVKGDLKTANESYDNLIKIKEHIIQNYNEILKYKKSIEEQLVSL